MVTGGPFSSVLPTSTGFWCWVSRAFVLRQTQTRPALNPVGVSCRLPFAGAAWPRLSEATVLPLPRANQQSRANPLGSTDMAALWGACRHAECLFQEAGVSGQQRQRSDLGL